MLTDYYFFSNKIIYLRQVYVYLFMTKCTVYNILIMLNPELGLTGYNT